MNVAIVSGPRSPMGMGLELAEACLLDALRAQGNGVATDIRVVGGRGARRHARRIGARWVPARNGRLPRTAVIGAELIHLMGLDLPPPRKKAFVATVHDLSPLHYDDEGSLPPWTDEVVARASLLLTPSSFTAAELHRHFAVPPERVCVFGGAAALEARNVAPLSENELRRLGIVPPLVLRYGGYTKRKNVPLLLDAWAQVPSGTLVLAGPLQPVRAQILSDAPSLDRVVVLDYTPEVLLARLLRSATALVSTSTYEGFGLPPLEAMAAGTPVVAVSTPFAREICGDAALLVEGTATAVSAALCHVTSDPVLEANLRSRGVERAASFTWNAAAIEVQLAYSDAIHRS